MDTAITEKTRVVASPNQVSALLSGETVILDMNEGVYFGLDNVATRVWALIQQPCSVGDIAGTITDEFDVERAKALSDVLAFCAELRERGLIEVAADSPAR